MALTPTTEKELGFRAPDFSLLDVSSEDYKTYADVKGENGTVVMFICNHCPFVIHVQEELVKLANDYLDKGVGFVAISANDAIKYPSDSPELMKELAQKLSFPFSYLYDESQEVARAYDAACTPDFSVFNSEDKCVYRGQLDGSRPGNNEPVSGEDLRNVLNLLLKNEVVPAENQVPSIGCNIKWK